MERNKIQLVKRLNGTL